MRGMALYREFSTDDERAWELDEYRRFKVARFIQQHSLALLFAAGLIAILYRALISY